MEFLLQLLAELFSAPSPQEVKTDIRPLPEKELATSQSTQVLQEMPEEEEDGLFGLMQFH